MKQRDPRTPEQWQQAVDAAHGALCRDAARQYGLVTGGPVVNVERCATIVEAGSKLGIRPRPAAVEEFVAAINSEVRG